MWVEVKNRLVVGYYKSEVIGMMWGGDQKQIGGYYKSEVIGNLQLFYLPTQHCPKNLLTKIVITYLWHKIKKLTISAQVG